MHFQFSLYEFQVKKRLSFWLIGFLIQIIVCPSTSSYELNLKELNEVMKNFVHVHGMKMDNYSYWYYPITLQNCALKCLEDETISCKSFSYCQEGEACSTYDHDRESVSPEIYNRPGRFTKDSYSHLKWDYFERKSEKYRMMEGQLERLHNLTEINLNDATAVLTSLADLVAPGGSGGIEGQNSSTVQPGELELAGKSLMMVIKLDPIANASLEDAKEFTDVMVNVSNSLTKPSYASAWQAAQKDPTSPGSSTIVTSAEELTKRVSAKLLAAQNATQGLLSEAEGVAIWLDFASSDTNQNGPPLDGAPYSPSEKSNREGNDDDLPAYVFPNRNVRPPQEGAEQTNYNTSDTTQEGNDFFDDVIILPRIALGKKSVVTNVRYKNLKEAMPTRCPDTELPPGAKVRENIMNSAVLTTSIFPRPPSDVFANEPVIIVFKHGREPKRKKVAPQNESSVESNQTQQKMTNDENLFCVFWKEGKDEFDGGSWSTEGCSMVGFNKTHTTCNCTHMTSFAVLLQIVDYDTEDDTSQVHLKVLSAISQVGCVLSLLGVIVMCSAFAKLKFHTENMKIHFNLGVAVGLADVTFLFEELAEGSRSGCVLITILLYYFNMAVLAWMMVEGVHLYSQVVVVFVSMRGRFKYYLVAGWGIPLFLLTISMGALNVRLGSHKTCWLSPADNSIWAFAAPAMVVIATNLVILASVVRIIVKIKPRKSNYLKISKLRNAMKGAVFLFPLLGTTWLFGLLSLSKETLLFQYLFAITNSLQGFFLFIFHCVCNSEVREDAKRHKWFRSSDSTVSSSNPHFLSHAFSFAHGIKRFRNSVSFEFPSSVASEDRSEVEETNTKRLRRISNFFPKLFSARLPTTISESEECEEPHWKRPSTDPVNPQPDLDKSIPLPGMPTKNDTIQLDRLKHHKQEKVTLDQELVDQMIHNALKELLKDIGPAEEEIIKKTLLEDCIQEEEDEREKKMKMSYDSGLNSIDNDSILEEDDDEWKANQQEINEDAPTN